MPANCRATDIGIGICPCHTTPMPYVTVFVTGASTVTQDGGLNSSIITTMGIASCGHPTIALTGSDTVVYEGKGVHRVGDMGMNCGPYTAVTGSPTQTSGG